MGPWARGVMTVILPEGAFQIGIEAGNFYQKR
jgi:hypothetical protein